MRCVRASIASCYTQACVGRGGHRVRASFKEEFVVAQGRTAGVRAPVLVSLSWHRKVESVLLELKATLVAAVPQMAGGALVICIEAPHLSHLIGVHKTTRAAASNGSKEHCPVEGWGN